MQCFAFTKRRSRNLRISQDDSVVPLLENHGVVQSNKAGKRRSSTGDLDNDKDTVSCRSNTEETVSIKRVSKTSDQNPGHSPAVTYQEYGRLNKRRNAICDPLRMIISQEVRERLEENVQRRKISVTRKVSQFVTVSLDLNRDEELLWLVLVLIHGRLVCFTTLKPEDIPVTTNIMEMSVYRKLVVKH